jgi:hypothetical protein
MGRLMNISTVRRNCIFRNAPIPYGNKGSARADETMLTPSPSTSCSRISFAITNRCG